MPTKKNVFISGETFPLHNFFFVFSYDVISVPDTLQKTVIYTRKSKTLNCKLNKPAKQEH